jgi:N-acetyl sugar amidotransferase
MVRGSIFLDEKSWQEEWSNLVKKKQSKKFCSRCLFDEETPGIAFDEQGECNYCKRHDELIKEYPGGDKGWQKLKELAEIIKKENRKKKYDVIIGVSGGCDSSYLIHLAHQLGLRPLAVHFDNTWNSTIAVENIHNVLKQLNIDLWTYVVDNEEYDDLYRSMLESGTPDLDVCTDLGLAATLNRAAVRFNTKYIFEGHSFRTEGLAPLGWVYMDAKYVSNIHKRYGSLKLKTFPNLWLSKQLKWMLFNRLKKIRPLWYIEHNKEETKEMLSDKYGWRWYGGHHLENQITHFVHTYFFPRRFGIDLRSIALSSLVRTGQIKRQEGLNQLMEIPDSDPEIVDMVKKRLDLTDQQFVKMMTKPRRSYRDFKTYKPLFEKMRPFFYLMAKLELIPMSFYIKYTSKDNI